MHTHTRIQQRISKHSLLGVGILHDDAVGDFSILLKVIPQSLLVSLIAQAAHKQFPATDSISANHSIGNQKLATEERKIHTHYQQIKFLITIILKFLKHTSIFQKRRSLFQSVKKKKFFALVSKRR
jgi:hypothetical protein